MGCWCFPRLALIFFEVYWIRITTKIISNVGNINIIEGQNAVQKRYEPLIVIKVKVRSVRKLKLKICENLPKIGLKISKGLYKNVKIWLKIVELGPKNSKGVKKCQKISWYDLNFKNHKKVELTLNRNQLATWIPTYATEKIINLSKRSIALVDTRTFMGLSHITNLSLNINSIKSIDSFVFNDLKDLIDLNLSQNLLSTIDPYTFTTLQSLYSLDLGFNKLTSLQADTLHHWPTCMHSNWTTIN